MRHGLVWHGLVWHGLVGRLAGAERHPVCPIMPHIMQVMSDNFHNTAQNFAVEAHSLVSYSDRVQLTPYSYSDRVQFTPYPYSDRVQSLF